MGSKDEEKKEPESESTAGGILKGIGNIIPGLGGLIKKIEKSPAFKERLKKVDKELERKIKEAPLKKTEGRPSQIPSGIPPGARRGPSWKKSFIGKRPETVKFETTPPKPETPPADIFDENDHIKVIAEIPGVEEKDININLQDDVLAISVDIPDHKYRQELKLPYAPKGKLEKTYKNGILEIRISEK